VVALVVVGLLVLGALGVGAFLLVRTTAAGPTVALRDVTGAGLVFGVPEDWTPAPAADASVAGVPVEAAHYGPRYECGGSTFFRGFAAALSAPGLTPDVAARELGGLAGTSFYTPTGGVPAEVRVGAPRPVDVGGTPGQLAEATITTPVDDGCLATGGTILVLAVPATGGSSVLVVNGDTAGGPADAPPVPPRGVLDAMIASARPVGI
jgi:hypothetical protein